MEKQDDYYDIILIQPPLFKKYYRSKYIAKNFI